MHYCPRCCVSAPCPRSKFDFAHLAEAITKEQEDARAALLSVTHLRALQAAQQHQAPFSWDAMRSSFYPVIPSTHHNKAVAGYHGEERSRGRRASR